MRFRIAIGLVSTLAMLFAYQNCGNHRNSLFDKSGLPVAGPSDLAPIGIDLDGGTDTGNPNPNIALPNPYTTQLCFSLQSCGIIENPDACASQNILSNDMFRLFSNGAIESQDEFVQLSYQSRVHVDMDKLDSCSANIQALAVECSLLQDLTTTALNIENIPPSEINDDYGWVIHFYSETEDCSDFIFEIDN